MEGIERRVGNGRRERRMFVLWKKQFALATIEHHRHPRRRRSTCAALYMLGQKEKEKQSKDVN